jgi:DUF971 family protein
MMIKDPFYPKVWPTHIKLNKREQTLDVEFDDGSSFTYTAEYLRIESPSAEVRGHGASQKQIVPGCRKVHIKSVEPIGNYAIRIHFDDNHNTGIYSWSYLHELGTHKEENWHRYLEILKSLGLSR